MPMGTERAQAAAQVGLANAHNPWLLFGATGVTGRLILDAALRRGHRPTIAGRNVKALRAIADPHGLSIVQAAADDAPSLLRALHGFRLVLNAAGPFAVTAPPLLDAALAVGSDYLDVNGELASLDALFARTLQARQRGVVLVGGAGFGVAASDGLAAEISRRLGGVPRLRIAVAADVGFASKAVAETTLAVIAGGGQKVADGVLVPARLGEERWREKLDEGSAMSFASAPLADLVAAARLTGAREIVAGIPMGQAQARMLSMVSPAMPTLLRLGPVRRALVRAGGHSTGARTERAFTSRVWVSGEHDGRRACARLETGEGFAAAATIAVCAVEALTAKRPTPGAYSPAGAFGADFIACVPDVRIAIEDDAAAAGGGNRSGSSFSGPMSPAGRAP